jgi:hypothetical protein
MSQLERLEALGVDLDGLDEPQRMILASLSAEEVDILVALRMRLDEAAGDVEAHQFGESGGAFW